MSGYQFLHIETFGTVVSKTKLSTAARKKGQTSRPLTVREAVDEALRRPGACPHVPSPQKPFQCFTPIPLGQLADEVEKRKAASKDPLGRSIRKDAQCMIGGVASFPIPMRAMSEADWVQFDEFLIQLRRFLENKFGSALANMTAHFDEQYPHVHFYVLPPAGVGTFSLNYLHPGIAGRESMGKAAKGGSPELAKIRNEAYLRAMRNFQDDFYREVASHFGMARVGPRKKRLSRAAWKAQQHENDLQAQEARRLKDNLDAALARVRELEALVPRPER